MSHLGFFTASKRLIDFLVFQHHFQQYFSFIMATSFSGGGSRSTRREPSTLDKLYHLRLRVQCTLFCNLQSQARTHVVLVIICLYEPLDPTIQLIEPPGSLLQKDTTLLWTLYFTTYTMQLTVCIHLYVTVFRVLNY